MAAEETPKKINYGSNSHKSKDDKQKASETPEKRTDQIVTGQIVVRKKSLGKKFVETFVQEDGKSLKDYLIFDVVVPATKNLLLDLVQQGSQRLFYGTSRPRSSQNYTGSGGGTQVRYNSMYGPGNTGNSQSRNISQQGRNTHDFSEVFMKTRVDADMVLDRLTDLIDRYGVASVSDFYDCVGATGSFTDFKYGWTNLSTAVVRNTREGYIIEFPQAVEID